MNRSAGKFACKTLRPFVRRKMDRPSARSQFMRQRFRRKHMPASPTGAKKRDLQHDYSAGTSIGVERLGCIATVDRGFDRVSASTNPIETAIATSDEPP